MKKQTRKVFTSILVASLLIGFSTTATAQVNLIALNDKEAEVVSPADFEGENGASSSATEADARASRNFSKSFKGISNAAWSKTKEGYIVQFNQDGIENLAFLNKKGNCFATIRYYSEKELPATVCKQVKAAFTDYNITSVKEVSSDKQNPAYVITISGLKTWKEVRVMNGELDVLNEYVKG